MCSNPFCERRYSNGVWQFREATTINARGEECKDNCNADQGNELAAGDGEDDGGGVFAGSFQAEAFFGLINQ